MIKEFTCNDGQSVVRIEKNGRVRFIMRPEDRVILWGQYTKESELLLLYKSRASFQKQSFTLGIPVELWENLSVKTVAIHVRENNSYYCTTAAKVRIYGYRDEQNFANQRHNYIFLDFDHWTEVGGLEDVVSFRDDNQAEERMKGGLNVSQSK